MSHYIDKTEAESMARETVQELSKNAERRALAATILSGLVANPLCEQIEFFGELVPKACELVDELFERYPAS